jgi:hypothetical protein
MAIYAAAVAVVRRAAAAADGAKRYVEYMR